ncbi:phosphatase PAP2 family protein [Lentzea tibetensis]|uniref:Phosphatase PAP2 family protein n=1 Tax=Lentzea tibetensis TaxID=2591470 RepID=A0A563ET07_9PSEU|nr:phosphatase PAP2 family protein [Lentzea tibetensis]
MIGCVAAFLFAYYALVLTSFGQRVENTALQEISLVSSLGWLETAVVVAGVAVVLLGRRRCLPALAVLGGSIALSQVLKLSVLERPLLDDNAVVVHNSFPSGHVTAAAAAVVAIAMVLPRRVVWLAVPLAGFPAYVAYETLALGWHRFSDALGAALLVSVVCCLVLRAWTRGALVPVVIAALGIYLMVFSSVPSTWLAAASVFALCTYCVVVVRATSTAADVALTTSGSVVEVGRDDRGDRFESGVSAVSVGGEHHLVTVHCPERHQSEHTRGFHGVAAVLPDGDLHRLVGGGLRQQCGRSGVQSDLAGHGDPSLRHDPSSSRSR